MSQTNLPANRPSGISRKFKLPHAVIVKAPGLLPMLYTVRELAVELGIPESTLRDWLEDGAPHQRDARKHIWINGRHFAAWVESKRKVKTSARLSDDQAYCLRCKTVVRLDASQTVPVKGKLIHIKGSCPQCGCVINRGGRIGKIGQSRQLFVD